MIDGRNFLNQSVKKNLITYDNIWKIAIGDRDNYTTGFLLDYNYFNNYYKMTAVDLSKQQALDANPKAIQQINFTGNLARCKYSNAFHYWRSARNSFMFFTRYWQSILILYSI